MKAFLRLVGLVAALLGVPAASSALAEPRGNARPTGVV
jgi:hypothetical protein